MKIRTLERLQIIARVREPGEKRGIPNLRKSCLMQV